MFFFEADPMGLFTLGRLKWNWKLCWGCSVDLYESVNKVRWHLFAAICSEKFEIM